MRPITANDLMNPDVLAVREDGTVRELAAFLVDNEISGAPVEDGEGSFVGVVSIVDVIRAFAGGKLDDGEMRVRDIMTPVIYSVSEDATVEEVATAMLDNHLHRLLVTRDGEPVGIVSSSDLLGLLVD